MLKVLREYFKGKKILILGFGVEGQSTYRLLRKLFPDDILHIADVNEDLRNNPIVVNNIQKLDVQFGRNYLKDIGSYDLVIKAPGISLKSIEGADFSRFTSHTELFIRLFKNQIIGITGTKGKSTTTSLIYHIYKTFNNNTLLVGNIGIPPFDLLDSIDNNTVIVYELSSHQLEQIHVSPHIAVLLNLYEEHLDHYLTFERYIQAKLNIVSCQQSNDVFIYNDDDERINKVLTQYSLRSKILKFSLQHSVDRGCYLKANKVYFHDGERHEVFDRDRLSNLIGDHNLLNTMAAVCACLISGIPADSITAAVDSFEPLEHRIEYVGNFGDVIYYNDSISTIPEATIAAVKSLKIVDTLILGGYDRGISYDILLDFIGTSEVKNLVFIGQAGNRMMEIYKSKNISGKNSCCFSNFDDAVLYAKNITTKGKICLLSPAAASYGMFRNFAERGAKYKQLVRS